MDRDMKSGFCLYCGNKIINDAISESSPNERTAVINHLTVLLEYFAELSDAIPYGNWEDIYDEMMGFVDTTLLQDADCSDAWYLKAASHVLLNDIEGANNLTKKGDLKTNSYGIYSKEDVHALIEKNNSKLQNSKTRKS